MLSNPLANPLFWLAFGTFAPLLGGGLAGIGVAKLRRRGPARDGGLLRRWLVWALIAPIFTVSVLAGPLALTALCTAIALQAIREYAALERLSGPYVVALVEAAGVILASALIAPAAFPWAVLAAALAITALPLLTGDAAHGLRQAGAAVFGVLYLPASLATAVLLLTADSGGPGLLLVAGLAVALSDVGAYLAGTCFGRTPLSPSLSPRKTVEGLAGNLAGAALGVVLLGAALPPSFSPLACVGLVLVVAAGAVWGDLLESLIKRTAGAKDAGQWLPGFGGLLDRVDSLLIALPLVYGLVAPLAAAPSLPSFDLGVFTCLPQQLSSGFLQITASAHPLASPSFTAGPCGPRLAG